MCFLICSKSFFLSLLILLINSLISFLYSLSPYWSKLFLLWLWSCLLFRVLGLYWLKAKLLPWLLKLKVELPELPKPITGLLLLLFCIGVLLLLFCIDPLILLFTKLLLAAPNPWLLLATTLSPLLIAFPLFCNPFWFENWDCCKFLTFVETLF